MTRARNVQCEVEDVGNTSEEGDGRNGQVNNAAAKDKSAMRQCDEDRCRPQGFCATNSQDVGELHCGGCRCDEGGGKEEEGLERGLFSFVKLRRGTRQPFRARDEM